MAKWTVLDDSEEITRWFKIDDDTEVHIKYLDRRALRKITAKAARAGRIGRDEAADYSNCLLGREAVLSWRKTDDHDHPGLIVKGRPLPFNQENLDMLMTKSLEFSRFVNEVCVDASAFDLDDEAAIKNG